MKRLTLWIASISLLMLLSATSAVQTSSAMRALDNAELAVVTAGVCNTCGQEETETYPTVVSEGWELVSRRDSSHTVASRKVDQTYRNNHPTITQHYTIVYSDECRRVVTGAGVSISKSLNISVNSVYHCAKSTTLNFSVPPNSSITLYSGTMRFTTTSTYRHVLQWSDGYREVTGASETVREQTTYKFLEAR